MHQALYSSSRYSDQVACLAEFVYHWMEVSSGTMGQLLLLEDGASDGCHDDTLMMKCLSNW